MRKLFEKEGKLFPLIAGKPDFSCSVEPYEGDFIISESGISQVQRGAVEKIVPAIIPRKSWRGREVPEGGGKPY